MLFCVVEFDKSNCVDIVPSNWLKLPTNITFTHCSSFSVLIYFDSNYSLLHSYISGRKEAVHIKHVSDLGLRLKFGTF